MQQETKIKLVMSIASMFAGLLFMHCATTRPITEIEPSSTPAEPKLNEREHAIQMWNSYLCSPNVAESNRWCERAAKLGDPDAQRWLAHLIIVYKHPHKKFGASPQDAVLALLTPASKVDGVAAHDLGLAYYAGFLGAAHKDVNARQAFQLAVSHHHSSSWEELARMLHMGEGGAADQAEAYYLIGLATQCTHPDSGGGKELWKMRQDIEAQLTLPKMKAVWERVDAFIARERKYLETRIYPPPFLGTGIPEKEWNEYRKVTDKFEAQHRRQITKSKG